MTLRTRRQFFTPARRATGVEAVLEREAADVTPTQAVYGYFTHQPPRIDSAYWSITVGGLVRYPLTLSYNDVLAMPAIDLPCTMVCASNPPGGERIAHVRWRGVPLRSILKELDLHPNATHARLQAAGGHVTGLSLPQLTNGVLAYAMNNEILPVAQGFPARLIVPGLYDHKQPRWIERVDLTDQPAVGSWERRGWSADGSVQTTAGILSPRHRERVGGVVTFDGYAFAGDQAITTIEVSVDDGAWMPVPFTQPTTIGWARWRIDWKAAMPGDYRVRVRATDDGGFTQGELPIAPFPNGSSAIHSIVVRVTDI